MSNAPSPRVELVVRVMPDGSINVSGPIHDRVLCYGLLEAARDIIKDHGDKATRSAIVPVRPADPFLLKQRPNGAGS